MSKLIQKYSTNDLVPPNASSFNLPMLGLSSLFVTPTNSIKPKEVNKSLTQEVTKDESLEQLTMFLENLAKQKNDSPVIEGVVIEVPKEEIVKEKEITKNQEIIEIDEKTILFTATMKGYEEYRTWILGMGECAEVIEPLELKADILNQIQSMMNLYK